MRNYLNLNLLFGTAFLTLLTFVDSAFCQGPPVLDRWKESGQFAATAWGRANGLQSDNQGDPFRLTWGIFREGSTIFSNLPPSDLRTRLNQIYSGGEAEWLPLIASNYDRWESLSGLDFTYEANDDGASFFTTSGVLGARADIRLGGQPLDGNSGTLGIAFSPNRDIVLDTSDNFYENLASNSLRLRQVMAHEVGHTLGMPHVINSTNDLLEPFYTSAFDGPQLHDIMMAQWGYGDTHEKANGFLGNDDFATAIDAGTIEVGVGYLLGEDARTTGFVSPDEVDFFSIDDESDVDTFRFSVGDNSGIQISLEALGIEYTTGPQGGTGSPFNSKARSDLSFELFDAMENSIALIDQFGLEGTESSLFSNLVAGDYFLKIYGADNPDATEIDTQFYSLSISAVPEPNCTLLLTLASAAFFTRRRKQTR